MNRTLAAALLLCIAQAGAQTNAPPPAAGAPGLSLASYTLERGPIALSAPDNCSGLAFCPPTRTIVVAVNKPPLLLEINLDGKTLRQINLAGFDDTEDVAWIQGNRLAVIEERRRNLCTFELAASARSASYAKADRWLVDPVDADNVGPEGVAWDAADNCFFVVKEKTPRRIYRVAPPPAGKHAPSISPPWDIERQSLGCDDLSGVCYPAGTGHLLILSDESKCVVETTFDGREIDRLKLKAGHAGLAEDIRQPEGITLDDAGRLYICSEPNHLYVFARKKE
jgi:uncharacterized protein YjiK